MSKKARLRPHFKKEDGKPAQALWKFERQQLYHFYWSQWGQLSRKKSLLVIWKILKLFLNTGPPYDKYFLLNRDNQTQSIQMQLYQKQKFFSELFLHRLKCTLNFQHSQKKDDPHSWCVSDITDFEQRG